MKIFRSNTEVLRGQNFYFSVEIASRSALVVGLPFGDKINCWNKRKIEAEFTGGAVTSDGGALLLREIDRVIGLTTNVSKKLKETRRKKSCSHTLTTLLRQRVYGIALGYEDLNDHHELRKDPCFQTALGQEDNVASESTLCRFENRADRQMAWAIHEVLVEKFIESFKKPPEELILDFDATDDWVHGEQEKRFFHGFYGNYCFLPLYVC